MMIRDTRRERDSHDFRRAGTQNVRVRVITRSRLDRAALKAADYEAHA